MLILLGVVLALIVVWLTSYMISALRRGEIAAPTSRRRLDFRSPAVKSFSRADAPFIFWFSFFVHFAVDAVCLAALVIIIYRFCL
jgi:hypothetical protein